MIVGYEGGQFVAYSANAPSLAANLLATIPSNPRRKGYFIQNQSASTIQVVFDDGSNSTALIVLLGPGSGANTQGGALDSAALKHTGRIRVYSANSTDQVAIGELV